MDQPKEKDSHASTTTITTEQVKEKPLFTCSLCNLSENYDYYGTNPPFCKGIIFKEQSYIMKDPFSSSTNTAPSGNFILLGTNCASCNEMICQDCSLFFTKTLCDSCVNVNKHLLPQEVLVRYNNKKKKD